MSIPEILFQKAVDYWIQSQSEKSSGAIQKLFLLTKVNFQVQTLVWAATDKKFLVETSSFINIVIPILL